MMRLAGNNDIEELKKMMFTVRKTESFTGCGASRPEKQRQHSPVRGRSDTIPILTKYHWSNVSLTPISASADQPVAEEAKGKSAAPLKNCVSSHG